MLLIDQWAFRHWLFSTRFQSQALSYELHVFATSFSYTVHIFISEVNNDEFNFECQEKKKSLIWLIIIE